MWMMNYGINSEWTCNNVKQRILNIFMNRTDWMNEWMHEWMKNKWADKLLNKWVSQ